MTVPRDIYDFFIEPIRREDQRKGHQFLQRYLRGHQHVWETLHEKIHSVTDLWSVEDCPDEQLKYLKWIVGWTSALDYVTRELGFDELRRLISISGRLWKERGAESAIVDVMFFATGARNRTWNWFDFRWIVGETSLAEDHQGWDPWIVGTDEETESNLRIVDDGALNRALVANLLKLMRAANEKWEITYLHFLDQFLQDGDITQWRVDATDCPTLAVEGGVMSMTDSSQVERTRAAAGTFGNEFSAFFRLRGVGNTTKGFGFEWNVDPTSGVGRYFARCAPGSKKISFYYMSGATPVWFGEANLAGEAYYGRVWYGYRVTSTIEETTKRRFRVYLDGSLVFSFLWTTAPHSGGTIGVFHEDATNRYVECSEAEVARLPADYDYIGINP